jgi:predicted membrane protein
MLFGMVCGYAYNNGLDKSTIFSFVPITLCFTSFSLSAYFLSSISLSDIGLLLTIYVALTILFQIGWEGNLKELEFKDEKNLLRTMGARVEKGIFYPEQSYWFGWGTKIMSMIVAVFILSLYPSSVLAFGSILFFSLITTLTYELIKERKWDRNKELAKFGTMEICSIYLMVWLSSPIIGFETAGFLMLFGLIYYISMNRILWSSLLGPRV